MCDELRENYKKCFTEHGTRQCRIELDELFKCLYENEFRYSRTRQVSHLPIVRRPHNHISCPDSTIPIFHPW